MQTQWPGFSSACFLACPFTYLWGGGGGGGGKREGGENEDGRRKEGRREREEREREQPGYWVSAHAMAIFEEQGNPLLTSPIHANIQGFPLPYIHYP